MERGTWSSGCGCQLSEVGSSSFQLLRQRILNHNHFFCLLHFKYKSTNQVSIFKIYLAFYHFSLPPLLTPFHKYHFLSGLLQKPDFPTFALTFGTFTQIHACKCLPEWFVTKQNQIMLLNCSNSSPTAFILVMS